MAQQHKSKGTSPADLRYMAEKRWQTNKLRRELRAKMQFETEKKLRVPRGTARALRRAAAARSATQD